MSSDFQVRDVRIYRPYPDAVPWDLLLEADPDEARVYGYADLNMMRVAKFEDVSIAAYVIRRLDPVRFELCNLVVAQAFRHKGLGSWLLGHVIGLTETLGAREVFVPTAQKRSLFTRVGFVPCGTGLLLTLTPE